MAACSCALPVVDWNSTDSAEAMMLFKQKMILFLEDEGITEDSAKSRKILRGIGDEGLKRLNASDLTEEKKQKPAELWNFFESQLKVNDNFRIHRLHLMQFRQKSGESFDELVTRARTLANKCQFAQGEMSERIIELIIVSTPHEGLRKELLGKASGYPLQDVLKEGLKYEALSAGSDQLKKFEMRCLEEEDVTNVAPATSHASVQLFMTSVMRAEKKATGKHVPFKKKRS